jgi:hypothetical protein
MCFVLNEKLVQSAQTPECFFKPNLGLSLPTVF